MVLILNKEACSPYVDTGLLLIVDPSNVVDVGPWMEIGGEVQPDVPH